MAPEHPPVVVHVVRRRSPAFPQRGLELTARPCPGARRRRPTPACDAAAWSAVRRRARRRACKRDAAHSRGATPGGQAAEARGLGLRLRPPLPLLASRLRPLLPRRLQGGDLGGRLRHASGGHQCAGRVSDTADGCARAAAAAHCVTSLFQRTQTAYPTLAYRTVEHIMQTFHLVLKVGSVSLVSCWAPPRRCTPPR